MFCKCFIEIFLHFTKMVTTCHFCLCCTTVVQKTVEGIWKVKLVNAACLPLLDMSWSLNRKERKERYIQQFGHRIARNIIEYLQSYMSMIGQSLMDHDTHVYAFTKHSLQIIVKLSVVWYFKISYWSPLPWFGKAVKTVRSIDLWW
jgi:hypothetical protein